MPASTLSESVFLEKFQLVCEAVANSSWDGHIKDGVILVWKAPKSRPTRANGNYACKFDAQLRSEVEELIRRS